jgi:hypothetical protein
VFHLCQRLEATSPPLDILSDDGERFLFTSESTNLRFHEARLFRPEQLPGYTARGPVASILGLVVGCGGNFMNVISSADRLLLNNGYHRAPALRALGVTHVPCVIQRGDPARRAGARGLEAGDRRSGASTSAPGGRRSSRFHSIPDREAAADPPHRKLIELSWTVPQDYLVG